MPRKHNYAGSRSTWSQDQYDLLNDLLDSERFGRKVPWADYTEQLGHPISSIYTMASRLRKQRYEHKIRTENAALRAAADIVAGYVPGAVGSGLPPSPTPDKIAAKPKEPKPAPRLTLDAERVNTSTQRMRFRAEMLSRIDPSNITAGFFGDPPPGRSALDEKRAGLAAVEMRRRGDPWTPKRVSLPSNPDRTP